MEYLYLAIWVIVGGALAYGGFRFNYKDAKKIDKLKADFKEEKKIRKEVEEDRDELQEKVDVLKDEIEAYLWENADLKKVVSELSIYAHHIKEWWEKAKELAKILWIYNKEISQKIEEILKDMGKKPQDEEEQEDEVKRW